MKHKITRWVLWMPLQKGNQVIIDTDTFVHAVQEAIKQVGGVSQDWTGYRLNCVNSKHHAKIIADSMILATN